MASVSSIRTVLLDLAPSYASADSDMLDRFIARALPRVNEDDGAGGEWENYEEAVALLALHNLVGRALDASGETARGAVIEEKTDNASTKYADMSRAAGIGPHGSTEWGRRFDELQANRIMVWPVI